MKQMREVKYVKLVNPLLEPTFPPAMVLHAFFSFFVYIFQFCRQPNHLTTLARKRVGELPQKMASDNSSSNCHWKLTRELSIEARPVGSLWASQTLEFSQWGHSPDTTTVEGGGGTTRDSQPYPASLSWRTHQEHCRRGRRGRKGRWEERRGQMAGQRRNAQDSDTNC